METTIGMSPSSTTSNTRLTGPFNVANHVDLDDLSNADNATASAFNKRDENRAADEWRVDIRIGGPMQHIGHLPQASSLQGH